MIRFLVNMPLFEWKISEIITDLPSTYEVDVRPSPWIAHPRDSLDDGSYILSYGINVVRDGNYCREQNLKFIVKRSPNYKIVERLLNSHQEMSNSSWLFRLVVIELVLSGIYIWWFIIAYQKSRIVDVIRYTGIAGAICVVLLLFSRIIGPHIGYAGTIDCDGTITLSASLLKVHYETLIVFFAVILLELAGIVVMLRQVVNALFGRNENPN
jgi:hypothetical protein